MAFLNKSIQNDIILKNIIKKKLETVNSKWMTIERNYEEKKKWNFLKKVTNRIWELPWEEAERRLLLLQVTILVVPAKQSQQHEGWWHDLSQNHIIPNQAGSYPAKEGEIFNLNWKWNDIRASYVFFVRFVWFCRCLPSFIRYDRASYGNSRKPNFAQFWFIYFKEFIQ